MHRGAMGAGIALAMSMGAPQAWSAPAWIVDKARSKLEFSSAFAGMGFTGAFQRWDAVIAFDPKDLASSKISATIDLASARTGDKDRDGGLPGGDWFHVVRFPKATFVSTAIKPAGTGRYVAQGVLTLKGVSKPVSLSFTVAINGATATASGQATVDRSQWKVGAGQFAGEDAVPHAVPLRLTLVASRR
ncbi:MAG: YceI family protein [Caulobacteraceae bacterium]